MTDLATHANFLAPELLDDPPEPDQDAAAPTQTEPDLDASYDSDSDSDSDPDPASASQAAPAPPGVRVAAALADGLERHGWRVAYRWTTPYGHAFDCERTGARYDVELRLLDPDAARWLVWAVPRVGLLRRLFKRGVSDPVEHALLLTHLGEILAKDHRVSQLQWTTEADAPVTSAAPASDDA